MQISEKRTPSLPKSEKGKQRLSGWDNIIWKMKKKPNALSPSVFFFSLSFLSTPFNRRKEIPRSAKVREILQFLLILLHRFLQGVGAWVCLSLPPGQDGVEPHLWALQGEASQDIRWPREGWMLPGGGAGQGDGRRNRKGPWRRALSRLFKLGGEV